MKLDWGVVIKKTQEESSPKIVKSDQEWLEQLSEEEFRVTRMKGTEMAFTGEFCHAHEPGKYSCKCCDASLFDSGLKFESGTGWPSFTEPIGDVIKYEKDVSHGMIRVEVLCKNCEAHLGHVFPDGPEPSGLRYCINSVSLNKE